MRLYALLLLGAPLVLRGQDIGLESIRILLEPMRKTELGAKARGATPALTGVKHQLRDWIESQLTELVWNGMGWRPNPTVLQEKLNDELSDAGLFCGSGSKIPCPDWSNLGFLEPIAIEMKNGALIVQTSVGIRTCGVDQSAYAYDYDNATKQWRRFWQTEQDDYSERKYFPQAFARIAISPTDYKDRSNRLILTMGVEPWCSSVWHPVYYRVWQTKAGFPEPLLLLDEREAADIGRPILGTARSGDVLMEYSVIGPDADRNREVRHYVLERNRLVRRDPVALTPRDFVAAWMRYPWKQAALWSEEKDRLKLEEWRNQEKNPPPTYEALIRRCTQGPDLWQVTTYAGDLGEIPVYFVVRWRPPYHFTMVSVEKEPNPRCIIEEPEADNPLPLFPDQ